MGKIRTIIDFSIILKELHGLATPQEKQLLEQWIAEDPSHLDFFMKVQTQYWQTEKTTFNEESLNRALQQISEKTYLKKKSSTPRKWSIGIALAVACCIVGVIIFGVFDHRAETLVETVNTPILPGSTKAILITGEQKVIDLSKEDHLVLKTGNTQVQNTGKSLVYSDSDEEKNQITEYHTLRTPRGGEYFLELSDGTKVWLNSESELRYPVHFESDKREVELLGEAYFEVAHNRFAPFFVSTQHQHLQVLGTSFNIHSRPGNGAIVTTLVKGQVELWSQVNHAEKIKLHPDEQCIYYQDLQKMEVASVDVYPFVAWKDGRFVFRGQTLGEIMETLSYWYDFEPVFANETLRSMTFTGNLKRYDQVTDILNKIQKTNEVKFEIKEKQIIIK